MTIGVGFLCTDGVVLCADRQITGAAGYKFEESKIFWSGGEPFALIFSYAGDPDAANVMFHRTATALREGTTKPKTLLQNKLQAVVEEIFDDKTATGLETLVGIVLEHSPPILFKTKNKKVVEGFAECIGSGDGSALRYLCNFLLKGHTDVKQAQILGSYIVSVANRYVDGCSGGPDVMILNENGTVQEISGGIVPN
jgi:20S proteasome alpha/beta subunit